MVEKIEASAEALATASRAAANTVAAYRRDLKDFCQYLLRGHTALTDDAAAVLPDKITDAHVRNSLAETMRSGASRATVQRRLFAIKAYFRWRESTLGAQNPARTMRSPKAEKRLPQVLHEDSVRRLVEAGGDVTPAMLRDRAILEVLYSSGLRVSELTGFCWRHLDSQLGRVRVRSGKGNRDRLCPILAPA